MLGKNIVASAPARAFVLSDGPQDVRVAATTTALRIDQKLSCEVQKLPSHLS